MSDGVKRIAILRTDGGVSVMKLDLSFELKAAAEAAELEAPPTEAEIIDRMVGRWRAYHENPPTGATRYGYVSHRVVEFDDLPPDRTFRDAWDHDLKVDMPRARQVHRQHMRDARTPKMAELDIEYQRADEIGDALRKSEIAAMKQALRDVTALPAIDDAKTPDELKAVWPAILAP